MLEGFLNTGVDPYPIIRLRHDMGSPRYHDAYSEYDTSMMPLIQPILEFYGSQVGLQQFQVARSTAFKPKPLRIWFVFGSPQDFWPPEGHYMTNEQIRSLHTGFEMVISYTEEDSDERKRTLRQKIDDIYEFCLHQYESPPKPHDTDGSSEYDTSEEVDESEEDQEDGDDDQDGER